MLSNECIYSNSHNNNAQQLAVPLSYPKTFTLRLGGFAYNYQLIIKHMSNKYRKAVFPHFQAGLS
jgi:hypothetical protein